MANEPDEVNSIGWMDVIGLPQILRILGVALHPSKLALALAAIFLTFALGGVLDWFWTRGGGIEGQAITSFIAARADGRTYEEGEGSHGIFEVWRHHEQRCVTGLLGAALPETSLATGTSVGAYVRSLSANRPLPNLLGIGYGVLWMAKSHPVFFLLFGGGSLLIWSLFGGAICRLAVVQFARDEKLPMRDALAYAWPRLLGSFLPAPCIPLAFILIIAIALTLGGALLRVPILGDLLSGVAFLLAILGGFVIAVLMVGLVVGGSLFGRRSRRKGRTRSTPSPVDFPIRSRGRSKRSSTQFWRCSLRASVGCWPTYLHTFRSRSRAALSDLEHRRLAGGAAVKVALTSASWTFFGRSAARARCTSGPIGGISPGTNTSRAS